MDFGLAVQLQEGQEMKSLVGTAEYVCKCRFLIDLALLLCFSVINVHHTYVCMYVKHHFVETCDQSCLLAKRPVSLYIHGYCLHNNLFSCYLCTFTCMYSLANVHGLVSCGSVPCRLTSTLTYSASIHVLCIGCVSEGCPTTRITTM